MSTKLNYTMRYDGATIAQVAAMLGDASFREQVCEDQKVLRNHVEITLTGAGKSVRIEQVQATAGLPSFATKVVGGETILIQSEQWSSAAHGDIVLEIPGKPGDVRGTATLVERDGGVDELIDFTVKVSIPLVGGKIEGLLKGLVEKALKYENRTGITWLATHP